MDSLIGVKEEMREAGQGPRVESNMIDAAQLSETVRVLASDEFYGRAPGGPGRCANGCQK